MKKKVLMFIIILSSALFIFTGCGKQTDSIFVDSISISKKNLYLAEGQTAQISAQVYPFNADNQKYEFVSSDNSVVTIDNGFVTAIKAGNATISAISQDGGFKDSCNVLVTTVKNNLALNNYNNMNMPMTISNQNETKKNGQNNVKNSNNAQKNIQKTSNLHNFIKVSENNENEDIDKKTTAKQILNNIKKRTIQEFLQSFDAGQNVFEEFKQDFNIAIDDIKSETENAKDSLLTQSENEKQNATKSFFDLQSEIFESMQNIQNQIENDIKNMKMNFVNQIDDIEQKIDSDDYVVETKDINGVKFVVISNKTNG